MREDDREMTNAEKFIAVFGVSFENFSERDLAYPYAKMKPFKVTMYDRDFDGDNRDLIEVYVNAPSEKKAREKAIVILGDNYRRYGNGRPQYCLRVERNDEEEYPDRIIDCRKNELPKWDFSGRESLV